MNEDDTFKRLKGLTMEEAVEIYNSRYTAGMNNPTVISIKDLDDYIELELRKYGWNLTMLEYEDEENIS